MQINKRTMILTIAIALLLALSAVTVAAQTETAAEVNWLAQYWNNVNLSDAPVVTRAEANINHNWGQGSPDPAVNPDRFSARWTTSVELEEGNYRFTTISDDGVRVLVDGANIIDNWTVRPETTDTAVISLSAGSHEITVEYFENTGVATMRFGWEHLDDPEDEEVTITPTSGPAGTAIAVTASGFTPNTEVTVGIGPAQSETTTDHTVVSDATGGLATQINVPNNAQPGDAWVVLARALSTGERATSEEFAVTGQPGTECGATYTVQPGDWLSQIARRCDTTAEAIVALNPQIVNPDILDPGQVLQLPGADATTQYNLNLRPVPTTASQPIDVIPAGTTVPVLAHDEGGEWLLVTYDGQQGWIAAWLTNIQGSLANVQVEQP